MAFDIEAARQAGKTDEEIAGYLGRTLGFDVQGALKAGKTPTQVAEYLATNEKPATAPSTADPPGLGSRVAGKLGEAYSAATNPEYSMSRKAVRSLGTLGEAAGDVMLTGAKGIYDATTGPLAKQDFAAAANYIGNTDIAKAQGATLRDVGKVAQLIPPETREDLGKAIQIPNLIPAAAGARLIAPAVKEGALIAADAPAVIRNALGVIEKKTASAINKGIEKGIRPTVVGKSTAGQAKAYMTRAQNAVKTIVENKDNLALVDANGNPATGLPQTLKQFSDAVEQTKRSVFRQYDDMIKAAGKEGATVDLSLLAKELETIAKNKVIMDNSPEIARYAQERAAAFKARRTYTAQEAQDAIAHLNESLSAFYKNPTYEATKRAGIDAMIVNNIRAGVDKSVESAVGAGYQELKKTYGALKAIEKDVAHRAIVDARKNIKGLIDFSDIMTSGELIGGILTGNPAMVARGAAGRGIKEWFKRMNSPNTAVSRMFKDVDNLSKMAAYQPKSRLIQNATAGMEESLGVLTPPGNQPAVRLESPPTRPTGNIMLQERAAQPKMYEGTVSPVPLEDLNPELAGRTRRFLGEEGLTTAQEPVTLVSPETTVKVTPDERIRQKVATLEAAGLSREGISGAINGDFGSLVSEARRRGLIPSSGPEKTRLIEQLAAIIESITGKPVKIPEIKPTAKSTGKGRLVHSSEGVRLRYPDEEP